MGLRQALGRGPIAIDTAVFIYFIEEHPIYLPLVDPVFLAVEAGELKIVTSAVTLLEALVVPLRAGDVSLADRYESLLLRSAGLRMIEVNRAQLRAAAQLRATHRIRTPDALQLAAALSEKCAGFLTNDRALPELPGLPVIQLKDYLEQPWEE